MKINNIPKLESTNRMDPDDLVKFFAWREVIQIFMDGLNLLDTINGTVETPAEVERPSEELPTHEQKMSAKNSKNKEAMQNYSKLSKKWNKFNDYQSKVKTIQEKEKKAMLVLVQALGPQALVKFKVNYTQKDTVKEFWNRITNHFLQDSGLVISKVERKLRTIRMENNEKVDSLADRMKTHASHLIALGKEVREIDLKETLIQAIQDSKQARKYENIIFQTVGDTKYKEFDFDMTVQKMTNMEGYSKEIIENNAKAEKDEKEKEKENPNTETEALFTQNYFGPEGGRGRGRGRGRFNFGGRGRGRGKFGRNYNTNNSYHDQQTQGNNNTNANLNYQIKNEYNNTGQNKSSNYKFEGQCYRCQKYGHKAQDCYSNMATVNFAKRMRIENNEVNKLNNNDESHDMDDHEFSI